MKIDPHDCLDRLNRCLRPVLKAKFRAFSQRKWRFRAWLAAVSFAFSLVCLSHFDFRNSLLAQEFASSDSKSTGSADRLLVQTIQRIALGPAFDAKVRQRVWVGGREILGQGTYEQAGQGTGQFNLQVTMFDGDGKHMLQQVSDGRLAWTREEIGGEISLRRVDVGRLDQWVSDSLKSMTGRGGAREHSGNQPTTRALKPSVRVGGWTEMLDTIASDYVLTLQTGRLEDRDVWIVKGQLQDDSRAQRMSELNVDVWPELCPTQVMVLIARDDDPETGFGKGLPLSIQYSGDPVQPPQVKTDGTAEAAMTKPSSTLATVAPSSLSKQYSPVISLIELYSIRPISPPSIGRFRFEHQDLEVNFTNETELYMSRYGIAITERQSRMLRR